MGKRKFKRKIKIHETNFSVLYTVIKTSIFARYSGFYTNPAFYTRIRVRYTPIFCNMFASEFGLFENKLGI